MTISEQLEIINRWSERFTINDHCTTNNSIEYSCIIDWMNYMSGTGRHVSKNRAINRAYNIVREVVYNITEDIEYY